MGKPKLLIADAAEEFRRALGDQVAESYTIRYCQNGREALELIRTFEPDALVLDLMIPEVDGISVLMQAAEQGARPVVLATTRFVSEYVMEAVTRLGVGYVILKPCDIRAAAARLMDLTQHLKPVSVTKPDPRTVVSNVLLRMSVPAKLRGYAALREGILLTMQCPGQMVTKELYPEVGRICGASKGQVERAMRSAIESAYDNRDDRVWGEYFNMENLSKRPSNGTFISTMAARLAYVMRSGEE